MHFILNEPVLSVDASSATLNFSLSLIEGEAIWVRDCKVEKGRLHIACEEHQDEVGGLECIPMRHSDQESSVRPMILKATTWLPPQKFQLISNCSLETHRLLFEFVLQDELDEALLPISMGIRWKTDKKPNLIARSAKFTLEQI